MGVPYTFATATTSIPLSQLDANFASPITLGNVAMTLSNTYTSIGNLTLTNVTISSASGIAANTVAYANSSGVLSGSSNLYFDGTKLGIGTIAPQQLLHVYQSAASTDCSTFQIGSASGYTGFNNFRVGTSGSGTFIGGTYTPDGSLLGLQGTNGLIFSTGGGNTSRWKIDTSGNFIAQTTGAGVIFNASGALTNSTLNDYEVGTWTPQLWQGSTQITSATSAYGYYVKIGQMLWFGGYFYKSSGAPSASGTWEFRNLPFSVVVGNGTTAAQCTYMAVNSAQSTQVARFQANSSSALDLYGQYSSTSWTSGYVEMGFSGCLETLA